MNFTDVSFFPLRRTASPRVLRPFVDTILPSPRFSGPLAAVIHSLYRANTRVPA
jgi:hypothetical protein